MDGEEHLRQYALPAGLVEVTIPRHLLDAVGDRRRAVDEARQVGGERLAVVRGEERLAQRDPRGDHHPSVHVRVQPEAAVGA